MTVCPKCASDNLRYDHAVAGVGEPLERKYSCQNCSNAWSVKMDRRLDVDYRVLLKRYIMSVIDQEGVSFIGTPVFPEDRADIVWDESDLTIDEHNELCAIDAEIDLYYAEQEAERKGPASPKRT